MKSLIKKIIFFFIVCAALWAVFYFVKKKTDRMVLENVDIVIRNGVVVTMDNQENIFNPGFVVIKDGKILDIGSGNLPEKYLAKKNINADGKVVMPGLINTHSHAAMALLTGVGEGQNLQIWLKTMEGYESKFNADDVYWGSLQAEIKMVKSGTTAFNDMYFFPESTGKAANNLGIRAFTREASSTQSALVNFALAPNPLLNYSVEELKQISKIANNQGLLIHIHFAEDANFRIDLKNKYGLEPIDLLKITGLINNKIILAHAVDLTPSEIREISGYHNISVSFNPMSEFNLQTPLTPVREMLKQNVNVALGTDGEPSSNLSIFEQMRFAGQKTDLNPKELLQLSTINGAKTMGMQDKIGSLEIGKQGDVILVDVEKSDDLYKSLVYNKSVVKTTIVAGKILMEDEQILTIDEKGVENKADNIKKNLFEK